MAISFQEIMDFKPNHNDVVYREIKTNLSQLLPFVGAGLTATFYGTWPKAIRSLGASLDESQQDRLAKMIDSSKYLKAAQLLEDGLSTTNLRQNLIDYFSVDKLTSD